MPSAPNPVLYSWQSRTASADHCGIRRNHLARRHCFYRTGVSEPAFAKDGEIFDFDGRKCIVIGGAYSVDKFFRLAYNLNWWEDEQPSDEIKAQVEKRLEKETWRVDVILSHTCPLKYEPTEVFLPGINQSTVDKSTEQWLDAIEKRLQYDEWYCGHYHTSKKVDKLVFMYKDISAFEFSITFGFITRRS